MCVIIKSVSELSTCCPIYCASGHFWPVCLVISEDFSSSVNVFAIFASMFATQFVAFRFIISDSIPD